MQLLIVFAMLSITSAYGLSCCFGGDMNINHGLSAPTQAVESCNNKKISGSHFLHILTYFHQLIKKHNHQRMSIPIPRGNCIFTHADISSK